MNASIATPSTNPPVVPATTASHALHSLVASVLTDTGFDGADASVVLELERMTFELITAVHSLSTSYAAHANRLHPTAYDLLQACLDQGFDVQDLAQTAQTKLIATNESLPIIPPPPPPPAMLLSDDESTSQTPPDTPLGPNAFGTKRKKFTSAHRTPLPDYAHQHAPPLPPAHSYRHTVKIARVPLPPTPSIAEMEGKLTQTRLVETELGRLIEGTTVSVQRPKLKTKKARKEKDKDKGKGIENAPPPIVPPVLPEGNLPTSSSDVPPSNIPSAADEAGPSTSSADGAGARAGVEAAASSLAPPPVSLPPPPAPQPPPAPFYPPAPSEPSGPDTYALLAQADAEGLLGVVNYRRKGART